MQAVLIRWDTARLHYVTEETAMCRETKEGTQLDDGCLDDSDQLLAGHVS